MKILAIINQKSCRSSCDYIEQELVKKFESDEIFAVSTANKKDAQAAVRFAIKKKFDLVIAVGGDGTINLIINEIFGTDIKLAIIPSGTANDLATNLGIPFVDNEAMGVIKNGRLKKIDVISVNDKYYITNGGLGFASNVAIFTNKFKNDFAIGRQLSKIFRSKIYILTTLLYLIFLYNIKKDIIAMKLNGLILNEPIFSILLNNQYCLGKCFKISPDAQNDDQFLDVCLINSLPTKFDIVRMLLLILKGKHPNDKSVKTWRADQLLVETQNLQPFWGDGELLCYDNNFLIKVIPEALEVVVPAEII